MAYALGRDRSMCKKIPLVQGYIPIFWIMAMQKGIFRYILLISDVQNERKVYHIQIKIYFEQKTGGNHA